VAPLLAITGRAATRENRLALRQRTAISTKLAFALTRFTSEWVMLHNLRAGAAAGQSGGGRHLGGRFAVARVPWPSAPKEVLTSLARPSFSVYNFQSSPVGARHQAPISSGCVGPSAPPGEKCLMSSATRRVFLVFVNRRRPGVTMCRVGGVHHQLKVERVLTRGQLRR